MKPRRISAEALAADKAVRALKAIARKAERDKATRAAHRALIGADDVPNGTHRGLGLEAASSPPSPTTAAPGTLDKVAILAARAAAGEELWHEEDEQTLDNADAGSLALGVKRKRKHPRASALGSVRMPKEYRVLGE